MEQTPTSFLDLVTKALRANFEDVANEPLPQRWLDLIHRSPNDRTMVRAELPVLR